MTQPDAVIVGGGITGLSCAYRLKRLGVSALVLESADRVGGVIRSERRNGHLVEWGPNSLLPTAKTFEFLDELGLGGDLIQANPKSPRYIVVNRRLRAVPFGPVSLRGLARAAGEPFVRTSSANVADDESVASFFSRRFGNEVHDRLAAPFVTGIFAGDTEKLSAAAVFPRIVEMERQHGSVLAAMLKPGLGRSRQRGRKAAISSFTDGMEALPRRLASELNVETRCTGIRIGKDVRSRATVLALPAHRAAEVVGEVHPDLAGALNAVVYAPVVVAAASLAESSLASPLRGFGFLAPRAERLSILGTVFSSLLFPNRAPAGRLLLTSFLGGALKPEVFDWPDERVWDVVCSELKQVLKASLQPEPVALFRHRYAIPQYNIGHRARIERITGEAGKCPGLFVTGNFLHGVSVPACIEQGEAAADAVAEYLNRH
jgi:oxygen-dependent protoporphyrinogen oxidase